MRKLVTLATLVGIGALLGGCASTPAANASGSSSAQKPVVKAPAFAIIQHQNTVLGADMPAWVAQDIDEIQALPAFKDKYVFKIDAGEAKDLDGAKIVAKKIDAASQISEQINQRVQNKFAGAQIGSKDKVETYFENVVKSLADAQIAGFKQEKEFWVQLEYNKADGQPDPDRIFFRYLVLFSIPKANLDSLVQTALSSAENKDKPKTEDEKTAREEVKKALASGF